MKADHGLPYGIAQEAYDSGQATAELYLEHLAENLSEVLRIIGSNGVEAILAVALNNDIMQEAITDAFPIPDAPLSGEFAGESIPEKFHLAVGDPFPEQHQLDAYEDNWTDGFWAHIADTSGELWDSLSSSSIRVIIT